MCFHESRKLIAFASQIRSTDFSRSVAKAVHFSENINLCTKSLKNASTFAKKPSSSKTNAYGRIGAATSSANALRDLNPSQSPL